MPKFVIRATKMAREVNPCELPSLYPARIDESFSAGGYASQGIEGLGNAGSPRAGK